MAYEIVRTEPHGTWTPNGKNWKFKADGKVNVTYIDPAKPGLEYTAVAWSDATTSKDNAVTAHIDLRKAAGLDYVGEPAAFPSRAVAV